MANSLQDQLLQAGLIDKKKAQKTKKSKHKEKVTRQTTEETKLAQERARQQREEKAERDRQLNLQQQREAEQKAIQAQIRQLVSSNTIAAAGDTPYNFTDQRKIKRIHVSDEQLDQLSSGKLAIVAQDEQYRLVPAMIAEKIRQRDEKAVILLNEPQDEDDSDDPYADYKIPDDLMW